MTTIAMNCSYCGFTVYVDETPSGYTLSHRGHTISKCPSCDNQLTYANGKVVALPSTYKADLTLHSGAARLGVEVSAFTEKKARQYLYELYKDAAIDSIRKK